ncbi:hypothetical protein Y1Q_0005992 [Alligator mississippiensis]|uniref:Uncharacterized protein n=1 Tax=Alligator mississippiensis TaxID=8496 RepID=A0A151N3N4_ALLMI|nr:hypothetical protein Y1Q_0005992 [Alligator mississippiensis]
MLWLLARLPSPLLLPQKAPRILGPIPLGSDSPVSQEAPLPAARSFRTVTELKEMMTHHTKAQAGSCTPHTASGVTDVISSSRRTGGCETWVC